MIITFNKSSEAVNIKVRTPFRTAAKMASKRPTAAKKHAITTRAVNGQWGVGVQYLSFEL